MSLYPKILCFPKKNEKLGLPSILRSVVNKSIRMLLACSSKLLDHCFKENYYGLVTCFTLLLAIRTQFS